MKQNIHKLKFNSLTYDLGENKKLKKSTKYFQIGHN